MDPLDDLLANLAGGSSRPPTKPVSPPPRSASPASKPAGIQSSIESLLQQIGTGPIGATSPTLDPVRPTPPAPADQALLGSIQTHYDRLDQDQLESERSALAAAAQLSLSRQRSVARLWLDRLDPNSGEALWFEQFAEGYGSRLEAAIELLAAEQS
jgi:hypothetical protein